MQKNATVMNKSKSARRIHHQQFREAMVYRLAPVFVQKMGSKKQ